jgi:uncharacterized protein with ParB-like and HNH nuclease domain
VKPAIDIELRSSGIADLLHQYRLRVPPNQRPYAWGDEHVTQLFDDWADAFQTPDLPHYFMGTIVLNRTSDPDILEVSDGQQRLATTAIFIAAVRDVLADGSSSDQRTSEKYTRNHLIEFEELVGDWVPRLKLNTQDSGYFTDSILRPPAEREKARASAPRASNERLKRAYELAKERVHKLQGSVSKENEKRHLYEWVNFLIQRVIAIAIIVPEDVDAFTMFETLNDRGLRASQVDNIKNRLFRESGARKDEAEDLWLSMIAQIESFGGDDTVINYLRHYWISETGPTREQDLAKRFRSELKGQAKAVTFARRLNEHAVDYESLFYAPLEHKRLDDLGPIGRRYVSAITSTLRIEQIRPLMMSTLRYFSHTEAVKAFQLMLSWSVRFLVVGTGGGGYLDRNYGLAAAKISNGSIAKARELRTEFANIAPTDGEFETAFRTHSIANAEIARYVCRSLEGGLREERHPAITYFDNTDTFNLEHVLPRNPSDEWDIEPDLARAFYKRIGNLALLDPQANVKIGNAAFAQKRVEYKGSPFLITKDAAQRREWSAKQIEDRQRSLAKLAPQIWPLTWS